MSTGANTTRATLYGCNAEPYLEEIKETAANVLLGRCAVLGLLVLGCVKTYRFYPEPNAAEPARLVERPCGAWLLENLAQLGL